MKVANVSMSSVTTHIKRTLNAETLETFSLYVLYVSGRIAVEYFIKWIKHTWFESCLNQ